MWGGAVGRSAGRVPRIGGGQGTPTRRINAKLTMPSTTRDAVTAAVTRRPARATTRTSTPRPSAAMDTVVSLLAAVPTGASRLGGIRPEARAAATARNPRMRRFGSPRRARSPAREPRYRARPRCRPRWPGAARRKASRRCRGGPRAGTHQLEDQRQASLAHEAGPSREGRPAERRSEAHRDAGRRSSIWMSCPPRSRRPWS